jgi:hypothetical protein
MSQPALMAGASKPKTAGSTALKHVACVLTLATATAIAACADPSPNLVAKINMAYNTTFHADGQAAPAR